MEDVDQFLLSNYLHFSQALLQVIADCQRDIAFPVLVFPTDGLFLLRDLYGEGEESSKM